LSQDEESELKALWNIYSEKENVINVNKKISKMEKRIRFEEFFKSPQGVLLNELNSRRVYGGGLSFEEKEKRKRVRMRQIAEMIGDILVLWGFNYEETMKGVDYYHYLYEKKLLDRCEREKRFREVISKSRSEMESINQALNGNWDSNSLTLFGVIISIGISVGFGITSLVTVNKVKVGLGSGIISVILSVILIKMRLVRKNLLLLMNKILK
jgi:hypothetical protein